MPNHQVKSLLQTAIETCVNKGHPIVPSDPTMSTTEYLQNIADGKNKKKKEQDRIEKRQEILKK
jgi:hypothetical protein